MCFRRPLSLSRDVFDYISCIHRQRARNARVLFMASLSNVYKYGEKLRTFSISNLLRLLNFFFATVSIQTISTSINKTISRYTARKSAFVWILCICSMWCKYLLFQAGQNHKNHRTEEGRLYESYSYLINSKWLRLIRSNCCLLIHFTASELRSRC